MSPIILDLLGTELLPEEIELLQHPLVGGIILFSRHYESPDQIAQLCRRVRQANPALLISVDHEGGRVQRFRRGFTELPSMGKIGELFETMPTRAIQLAHACGWLMATELGAVGVDFSFAPVLDLDQSHNPAISDRAFHVDSDITISLATSLMQGMHAGGMKATGKHFPGHGSVLIDSHLDLPRDERHFSDVSQRDLLPFKALIDSGIDAIMPAHILFPHIDSEPVGFSRYWLQEVLRTQLKFSGIIFSDDLNMKGASCNSGDYAMNAQKALEAGCDAILICNNREGAIEIIDALEKKKMTSNASLQKMKMKTSPISWDALQASPKWQTFNAFVMNFLTQEIS